MVGSTLLGEEIIISDLELILSKLPETYTCGPMLEVKKEIIDYKSNIDNVERGFVDDFVLRLLNSEDQLKRIIGYDLVGDFCITSAGSILYKKIIEDQNEPIGHLLIALARIKHDNVEDLIRKYLALEKHHDYAVAALYHYDFAKFIGYALESIRAGKDESIVKSLMQEKLINTKLGQLMSEIEDMKLLKDDSEKKLFSQYLGNIVKDIFS